jgi:hypothetical protein
MGQDTTGEFVWDEGVYAAVNYSALGERLARSEDLFRGPMHGSGLILLLPDGKHTVISKGVNLMPVIVDRVPVRVVKDGKTKGSRIDAAHLNAMLRSEAFLNHFTPVDLVSATPAYLPGFRLTSPGFNDGGVGRRVLDVGPAATISDRLDTVNAFLDVMAFESPADRTNAVAAALTVMLRSFWPGGKPIIVVTATKSHAGKDTVILFATGVERSVSISYQGTNWAFERSVVAALKTSPETAVVVVENARMERREKSIASAFLERLATDPEPLFHSTGTGVPLRRRNDLVLSISTNYGSLSEDILNRALPIHLNPVGNITDRVSAIGNPKHEFLPANREQIAAELRGMIRRWVEAGQPLDEDVRHPFSPWAKHVGGILKVNGFTDFLGNYHTRKTVDDPVRSGLGILGASRPDDWLGASEWAKLAVDLGLTRAVVPPADQNTEAGRKRGIGTVLSAHLDETFEADTDADRLTLRLEKLRRRWDGGEPHVRYRFRSLGSETIPADEEQDDTHLAVIDQGADTPHGR